MISNWRAALTATFSVPAAPPRSSTVTLLPLSLNFDPATGLIPNREASSRYLSELSGCFADEYACQTMLSRGDPLVYGVTNLDLANGEGQLHYGLGIIRPGKVGREYFMTRGHLHAWRPAAEVYICLQGQGMMILEHESDGPASLLPFSANSVVYVPGYTAHRTVNIGTQPLVYWGILSAKAGHDYEAVGRRNFSQVVVELNGQPTVLQRGEYGRMIAKGVA